LIVRLIMRYLKFVLISSLIFSITMIASAQSNELKDLLDEAIHNYWILNDNEAALERLNELIELDDSISDAYVYRAAIYREDKDYEASFADFERALELTPDSALAYSMRARAYSDLQQFTEAIADADYA